MFAQKCWEITNLLRWNHKVPSDFFRASVWSPQGSKWIFYIFKRSELPLGSFWAIIRPSRPKNKNFGKNGHFSYRKMTTGVPWWSNRSKTMTTGRGLMRAFQRALVCSKMLRNKKVISYPVHQRCKYFPEYHILQYFLLSAFQFRFIFVFIVPRASQVTNWET